MSIKPILEKAVLAPSGDNCQPWRLDVTDNRISIFNLPGRDASLFNYRQRASLVGLGALIENILIASAALGYTASLTVFPDKTRPDFVAEVSLEKSDVQSDPLYPYISKRSTNRERYKRLPLKDEQRSAILSAPGVLGFGTVRLLEGGQKDAMAKTVSLNDRIVFENQRLHSFLFKQIRWTEKEAWETGDGLYIKTLGVSGSEAVGFRFLRNWPLVEVMNKFGLSLFIAKKAEKLCESSSALGIITISDNSDEGFLKGGRLVQRVWLEATRTGLSFQPITGITFLIQRVLAGETEGLSGRYVEIIRDIRKKITVAFGLKDETIIMLFRVGPSDPPRATSLRLPFDKTVFFVSSKNRESS